MTCSRCNACPGWTARSLIRVLALRLGQSDTACPTSLRSMQNPPSSLTCKGAIPFGSERRACGAPIPGDSGWMSLRTRARTPETQLASLIACPPPTLKLGWVTLPDSGCARPHQRHLDGWFVRPTHSYDANESTPPRTHTVLQTASVRRGEEAPFRSSNRLPSQA